MNKKIIIVICFVTIFLGFIVIKSSKNRHNTEKNSQKITQNTVRILKDDVTEEYLVYNLETGDVIARGMNKEELYIYEIDPDYDPKVPNE